MANENLAEAKRAKNDEFYTQYADIEKEMNAYLEYDENVFRDKTILLPCDDPEWSNFTKYFAQNFERFGLKKLISTSYALESKKYPEVYQISFLETNSERFDEKKTNVKGKIFTLNRDVSGDNRTNVNDIEWDYLDRDGDFRSDEVTRLRDEADIIITNPPFSLFREFLAWIVEAEKQFVIIGNMNAITYKEVFPLIMENRMWTGKRFNKRINGKNMTFFVPDSYHLNGTEVEISDGKKMISVAGTGWFTNIDHGRRHNPLSLMTMADNLRFSKHNELRGKEAYDRYDNYNAIEVPFTDAIPSDYEGVMGVPISFLDKYCPEQFEILGSDAYDDTPPTKKYSDKVKVVDNKRMKSKTGTMGCVIREENFGSGTYFDVGYPVRAVYKRLFIKHRSPSK